VATEFYASGRPFRTYETRQGRITGLLTEYYPNGCLRARLTYRDNLPHGSFREYYPGPDTLLRVAGQYRLGRYEGSIRRYWPNGQLQAETQYTDSVEHGPYRAWNAQGVLVTEGDHFRGMRDGIWTFRDDQGRLTERISYRHGELNGFWASYSPNGRMRSSISYEANERNGLGFEFDSLGNKVSRFVFAGNGLHEYEFFTPEGQRLSNGGQQGGTFRYVRLAPSGVVLEEGDQLGGTRHGEWTVRYRHGKVQELAPHVNGQLEGLVQRFWPDGALREAQQYSQNEPNGLYYTLHPDGQLAEVGQFVQGTRQGYRFVLGPNGKVLAQEYYRNDSLFGPQRYFAPNGDPLSLVYLSDTGTTWVLHRLGLPTTRDTFSAGCVSQIYAHCHAAGAPWHTGPLLGGRRTGQWWYRDTRGQITGTEHYQHDALHGETRLLVPNGPDSLLMRGHYQEGERDSVWEWYHSNGRLRTIGQYCNGLPNGPWLALDDAGHLLERTTFHDGLYHGVLQLFGPDSALALALRYSYGELFSPLTDSTLDTGLTARSSQYRFGTGLVTWHQANGRPTAQASLVAGQFHGEVVVFQPAGDSLQPFRVLRYWYGKPHGKQELYAPNGQLIALEEFRFGEPTGQWRYFNPQGQLLRNERYDNGLRHGPTEYYTAGERLPRRTDHFFGGVLVRSEVY
jgi:antitoxin component YwqK of YwqJK toxin-antitoxin module